MVTIINKLSKELGCTKQAVSRRLLRLTDDLGCKFYFQRSDKVRKTYAQRAIRVHKRRKKEALKYNFKALMKLYKIRVKPCP